MQGIIYKVIDYKDKSKICYLYSEEGLTSIKVLGGNSYKNKNFSFSNIYTLVDFKATSDKFKTLIDYDIIDSYQNIKNSYNKAKVAYVIIEVIRKCEVNQYNRVFNFLKRVFDVLNNDKIDNDVLFIVLVKYLKLYGILPVLDEVNMSNFSLDKGFFNQNSNDQNYNFGLLVKKAYYTKEIKSLNVSLADIDKVFLHYEKNDLINMRNIKKVFYDK